MRVIYLPLTLPWHVRVLVGLLVVLAASIVMIVACSVRQWYTLTISLPVSTSTDTDLMEVRLGLLNIAVEYCGTNPTVMKRMCDTRQIVFSECGMVGRYFTNDAWCAGGNAFLWAFGLGLCAALLGLFNIGLSFFRERWHGIVSTVCVVLSVAAGVCFAMGKSKLSNSDLKWFIASVQNRPGAQVSEGLSSSVVMYSFAVLGFAASAALGLSLFVCAAREITNVPIAVTRSDVTGGAATQISRDGAVNVAPLPGFVALSSGNNHSDHDAVDYNQEPDDAYEGRRYPHHHSGEQVIVPSRSAGAPPNAAVAAAETVASDGPSQPRAVGGSAGGALTRSSLTAKGTPVGGKDVEMAEFRAAPQPAAGTAPTPPAPGKSTNGAVEPPAAASPSTPLDDERTPVVPPRDEGELGNHFGAVV